MAKNDMTAASLNDRFKEELYYIGYLLGVVHSVTLVDTFTLFELSGQLRTFNLLRSGESLFPGESEPRSQDDTYAHYTRYDYHQLHGKLPLVNELIRRVQPLVESSKENIEYPEAAKDYYDPTGTAFEETVHYLQAIRHEIGEQILSADSPSFPVLRKELINSLTANDEGIIPSDDDIDNAGTLVDHAFEVARWASMNERHTSLSLIDSKLRELDLCLRTTKDDSEVNVWRQAFISVMTVFDATVFDVVRVAFKNAFFQVLGAFALYTSGEKAKLSLRDISDHGSFDALMEELIEGQLKTKYLKDLLFILKNMGAMGVGEEEFPYLVEMVLRRNIHIHNRGRVDRRYLEGDGTASGGFNLYGFSLGAVAVIDRKYLEEAMQRCEMCIQALAAWADGLEDTRPNN